MHHSLSLPGLFHYVRWEGVAGGRWMGSKKPNLFIFFTKEKCVSTIGNARARADASWQQSLFGVYSAQETSQKADDHLIQPNYLPRSEGEGERERDQADAREGSVQLVCAHARGASRAAAGTAAAPPKTARGADKKHPRTRGRVPASSERT